MVLLSVKEMVPDTSCWTRVVPGSGPNVPTSAPAGERRRILHTNILNHHYFMHVCAQ